MSRPKTAPMNGIRDRRKARDGRSKPRDLGSQLCRSADSYSCCRIAIFGAPASRLSRVEVEPGLFRLAIQERAVCVFDELPGVEASRLSTVGGPARCAPFAAAPDSRADGDRPSRRPATGLCKSSRKPRQHVELVARPAEPAPTAARWDATQLLPFGAEALRAWQGCHRALDVCSCASSSWRRNHCACSRFVLHLPLH